MFLSWLVNRYAKVVPESGDVFRLLTDSVRDYAIYLLDRGGNVMTWGKGAERILGCAPEEIIGRHFSRFFPPEDVLGAKPELLLDKAAAEGRFEDEDWHVGKNGRRFWANIVISALHLGEDETPPGFAVVLRDMTERKRFEEALRASEQKFRMLSQSAADAIMTLDRLDNVVSWNLGARFTFGYNEKDILGKPFSLLLPERCRQTYWEGFKRMPALSPRTSGLIERHGLRKDGTEFPMELTLSAWDADGQDFITAIIRDVSLRKGAEQVETLLKREALQREFVANVSHELRTPIAAIKGFAETLRQGGLEDEKNRLGFVRIIERHAERLSDLVESLLELAALEKGKTGSKPEIVDLAEFVDAFLKGISPLVGKGRVSVEAKIAPGLKVIMDRVQLSQVFSNLCENAIKYNRPGGWVKIEALRDGEWAAVSIQDSGIGIPAEDLPHIFERFRRTDKARLREERGTGLGLSIVRSIILDHRGTISAESRDGQGSAFRFTLPAA